MMPYTPTPPPPSRFPSWVFIPIAMAVVVVCLGVFVGIWQFLAPSERLVPVAYSDFVTEVRAGNVEDIRIHDREYRFRVHAANGRTVVKEAIGPVPDQAVIDSLKPDDPTKPTPKIIFEK